MRGVGCAVGYWIPRPAEGAQERFSGDGPKVLGLLRGRPGVIGMGCWKRFVVWSMGKVDMLMSGKDARAYWFHCWDSTEEDGKGVR